MGFETLPTAISEGDVGAPLTAEELLQDQLSDDSALKLVLLDTTVAEKYVSSKALPDEWNRINEAYRAAVKQQTWPGSNVPRASLSRPVIMEAVENLVAQVHMAFFSEKQPFSIGPKGKTTPAAARAIAKVLCWAMKQAGAKEEFRKMLKSSLLYGQLVGKWGWQIGEHDAPTYNRGEDGKVAKHNDKKEISQPTLEFIELPNILVDPSLRCHDIRRARYVIHQMFWPADELEYLADAGYDNVPTREELAEILAAGSEATTDSLDASKVATDRQYQAEDQTKEFSANPLNQPLEILEYWTNDRVITVLQRKIVLRNEDNEFGCIPFNSCSFIDVVGAWYAFGCGRLLDGEQRFQAGVTNLWIDGLSMSLNPMFHRKKGIGASSQNIAASPGRVINDDGELAPLPVQSNTQEAMLALDASEHRASRLVGANFGAEMPTQAMRTAEGVNAFSASVQTRLQYFVENFADLVYIPVLEAFIQLCKDNLQPEQINAILSEEDGKAYEGDALDIYNGGYSVEVLSSTKLTARRAMAALIPQFVNLFSAAPVQQSLESQAKKFDYAEFIQQAIDLTGWPVEGLIVDMTPEDQKRAMMNNPAVIAAQAKSAQLDQKHTNDMAL
jgi:hypothetical protein